MKTVLAITSTAMAVRSNLLLSGHPIQYTDRHFLAFLLPNDESENDRLDMMHELCLKMLHRKLYLAQIRIHSE